MADTNAPNTQPPAAPAPKGPEMTDEHRAAVAEFDAAKGAHAASNGHHNAKVLCRAALAKLRAIVEGLEKVPAELAKVVKEAEAWVAKNAPEPKK